MTEYTLAPETPWEYEEQERGQRYRIFIPVPPYSGMTVARNIVGEERAQLIASAPRLKEERDELLVMLKMAERNLTAVTYEDEDDENLSFDLPEIRELIERIDRD